VTYGAIKPLKKKPVLQEKVGKVTVQT